MRQYTIQNLRTSTAVCACSGCAYAPATASGAGDDGEHVATRASPGALSHGTRPGLSFLAGADETGTGELLAGCRRQGLVAVPPGAKKDPLNLLDDSDSSTVFTGFS